jgi:endonuclease III
MACRNDSDRRKWKWRMSWLIKKLDSVYRSPRHGNLKNPTDELVFIILSNKTPPARYVPVFWELRRRFRPWGRLLTTRVETIRTILRPLGLSARRSVQLVLIARRLKHDFGAVSLTKLRVFTSTAALEYLLSLPGIGEKSARCILLYSFGVDVSPMDTHAMRVAVRFGLLPQSSSAKSAHMVFDDLMPKGKSYAFHVNAIAHGRAICTAIRPRCGECIVNQMCPACRAS